MTYVVYAMMGFLLANPFVRPDRDNPSFHCVGPSPGNAIQSLIIYPNLAKNTHDYVGELKILDHEEQRLTTETAGMNLVMKSNGKVFFFIAHDWNIHIRRTLRRRAEKLKSLFRLLPEGFQNNDWTCKDLSRRFSFTDRSLSTH